MAVRSIKRIRPRIWIPPKFTANYKVTVERSDGTIDDITDFLMSLKIEDGATGSIGNFEFELPNPNETYTNLWKGMEIFRFFCDYASDPTTLRFRGRIEKPSNRNNNMLVTGRSESLFVQDQDVHKTYVDEDVGVIIKDLFDTYGQGRFDASSINISTGLTLSITLDIPFWEAIESVCTAVSYDCYIDPLLVVQFFLSGSRKNSTDAIIHEFNLIEVGDFAPDLQFVKNQIRVTGGSIDGVQIIYTANDRDSQARYGIRRDKINDDGIISYVSAKEFGDFILADRKDPPITGDVKSILLATIQPGENLNLSSPMENIPPTDYRIITYKHEIGQEGLFTTVTINKESKRISHVLKDRIQREHRKTEGSGNIDDLDFSQIELFNIYSGNHTNTEIVDGILKLTSGNSSGNWISNAFSPGNDEKINQVKIGLIGDSLPSTTIEVSIDGGVNYTTVGRNELVNFGSGLTIIIKLSLTSATQIDSLKVQYSTQT